ncbi:MAG: SAM-dependent methyltransferase, partial [Thermoleophilia bacterium]|nr:class I SAM-dependent methyltransferase [Gaiellaceae bacterium]MDW8338068.1 SAM-dependent methyltransferase [Thermoleophilia bacterium]
FQDDLALVERWSIDGSHYARTCEAWLSNLDRHAAEIRRRWGRAYVARWRAFFLACAELFAYGGGTEWRVAHYLFRRRSRHVLT